MANSKKEFNLKLYAVIVFFLVAGFLAGVTVGAYTNRYNGFSPEKVAVSFVESIVNRGDGYNAYKSTIMSKNYKYGDYIREYYMYPRIFADCDYKPLDNRDGLKGFNDDSYKGEKTLNDTGKLQGQVIDTMYPFYVELIEKNNGWDNYDIIFKEYFVKLAEVREEIFGDRYLTDEIMFTALEANVSAYGDFIAGDENGTKSYVSLYQQAFGGNYKISYETVDTRQHKNLEVYKSSMPTDELEKYKVSVDDISDAVSVTVNILVNGEKIDSIDVNVVKINSTWYVDNINTNTKKLYDLADVK